MMPGGGDFIFSFMTFIFPIFFITIFGLILFTVFKGIRQWNYNNKQPVLTIPTKVVSKRSHVSRHSHGDDDMHHSSSTTYYATFEVESGDRMELSVPDQEFGMLVEGDEGKLTFQGTRYLSFERDREKQITLD